MSFRFWRRVKVMPGVTVNFSKSGASLSLGTRGAHYTVGPRGRRTTVGLPGTGLFYTQSSGRSANGRRNAARPRATTGPPSPVDPKDQLRLGFWKRLTTAPEEQELVAGIRSLLEKDEPAALEHLRRSTHLADGAFMAGFLAYKHGDFTEAAADLRSALARVDHLGRVLGRYGASAILTLAITDTLSVHLQPNEEGVLLVLTETCQRLGNWAEATSCLERLGQIAPDDVVVKVSLAELLFEQQPNDAATQRRVLELTAGVTNDSPVHAAALLYRGRALRQLGVAEGAIEVLTLALGRRAERSPELLRALRYERALAYDQAGQPKRARSDLERIYGEDPNYADIATRLGIAGSAAAAPTAR